MLQLVGNVGLYVVNYSVMQESVTEKKVDVGEKGMRFFNQDNKSYNAMDIGSSRRA